VLLVPYNGSRQWRDMLLSRHSCAYSNKLKTLKTLTLCEISKPTPRVFSG
jgi:hypothetical protein